uniref:Uncharacterized protein n=1 Tax=Aquilaria malaccensis TaxID=223753 RepID=A0A4Y6GMR5_9ROSI|nr:hypothetical protein [Aquilaria malaccensis]
MCNLNRSYFHFQTSFSSKQKLDEWALKLNPLNEPIDFKLEELSVKILNHVILAYN